MRTLLIFCRCFYLLKSAILMSDMKFCSPFCLRSHHSPWNSSAASSTFLKLCYSLMRKRRLRVRHSMRLRDGGFPSLLVRCHSNSFSSSYPIFARGSLSYSLKSCRWVITASSYLRLEDPFKPRLESVGWLASDANINPSKFTEVAYASVSTIIYIYL